MLQLQEIFRSNSESLFPWQPGEVLYGGYFAGLFMLNATEYGLIVSPAKTGEFLPTPWGAYEKVINAASYVDGFANTRGMAEAGHELACQVLELQINGYNDWYIPARDELEIIYRQLKPTAEWNLAAFRDGENPGSVPPGHAYSFASPMQTGSKIFQSDGEEALAAGYYWSSTQSSLYAAWTQNFKDGNHHTSHKVEAYRVRLVRRFRMMR